MSSQRFRGGTIYREPSASGRCVGSTWAASRFSAILHIESMFSTSRVESFNMAPVPTFRLHVVDFHGEVYNGHARFVVVPAEMGDVGILPGHAPLLSGIRPGELRITQEDGALQILFLDGGMLEVQPYLVSILADASLRVPDIDLKDTEARLQAAQRALSEHTSEMNLLMAEQELKRELAKIQAHQRYQQNLQLGKADGYDWRRPPLTGVPEISIQDLEE